MAKKEKITKLVEISLHDGPLSGQKIEVSYPAWDSYVLNMGQNLYVRKTFTDYDHTEDWSLLKTRSIKEILNDNSKD
jgi:hypothetical protein